jgi:hypothetical protein
LVTVFPEGLVPGVVLYSQNEVQLESRGEKILLDSREDVMPNRYSATRSHIPLVLLLLVLLVSILGVTAVLTVRHDDGERPAPPSHQSHLLAETSETPPKQFSFSTVPGWLFAHVGAVAALQVVALLFAVRRASNAGRRKEDLKIVQFLVEIPMYLGLFGTLLGVCLTQFIAGSLVAPLAYVTTMSGILLHVMGKLTILLPMPEYRGSSEE